MDLSTDNSGRLRFGAFELDVRSRELRTGTACVRLQEQPFEILRLMLERPGEVVTREELRQRLWPEGTFVDFEHSLNAAIKRLRAALGDEADNPRFVQTLPRRGYRFIGAFEAEAKEPAAGTARIRLAVLPFTTKTPVTQQYPEEPTRVLPGYRGAPYLVRDQDGATKCVSCQLCEFVCPPKAIRITPPGPTGKPADRTNAEKMPEEFEINMLRCIFCGLCQEVCPEEAIFLKSDFSLTGLARSEMIYDKEKLLALGGTHPGIQKWKHNEGSQVQAEDCQRRL